MELSDEPMQSVSQEAGIGKFLNSDTLLMSMAPIQLKYFQKEARSSGYNQVTNEDCITIINY